MSQWNTSDCKGCGEPMIWTITRNKKKMPLDPDIVSRKLAGPKALLFTIGEPDPEIDKRTPQALLTHGPEGHLSHWATCDKREEFRK